ncbi:hypothetical protein [Ornithinimicrobium kibberense]|uniref:hypothetical protein n=1 Tax=Ornithinimicrobium kibberense TaxID=282060 RepID=UPI003619EA0A
MGRGRAGRRRADGRPDHVVALAGRPAVRAPQPRADVPPDAPGTHRPGRHPGRRHRAAARRCRRRRLRPPHGPPGPPAPGPGRPGPAGAHGPPHPPPRRHLGLVPHRHRAAPLRSRVGPAADAVADDHRPVRGARRRGRAPADAHRARHP